MCMCVCVCVCVFVISYSTFKMRIAGKVNNQDKAQIQSFTIRDDLEYVMVKKPEEMPLKAERQKNIIRLVKMSSCEQLNSKIIYSCHLETKLYSRIYLLKMKQPRGRIWKIPLKLWLIMPSWKVHCMIMIINQMLASRKLD